MLRASELAGAGLDVYANSKNINPRLRDLNNVMMLPHMGIATHEIRAEKGQKVIINIRTFEDGHRPPAPQRTYLHPFGGRRLPTH
mgnify:CR=1 FL=1